MHSKWLSLCLRQYNKFYAYNKDDFLVATLSLNIWIDHNIFLQSKLQIQLSEITKDIGK